MIAAGKGTRYEPHYHRSTPDTVWEILDKYLSITDRNSINPKMFNSFVDGTKSGIEMTAVCNATALVPQSEGLAFPPATRFELAEVCKPRAAGGTLEKAGVTEVTSSVYRDGRDVPHHLALGTYVVFEGESDYARRCFKEYAMLPDSSGRYAALYRPIHMIGLELGVSIASAALRKEPTGTPTGFRSDVVATAKRALKRGEVLDGEGGFCVWGKQVPAERSLAEGLLPLGLAHEVGLRRDLAEGECLKWSDVVYDENDLAVKARREMEAAFGRPNTAGPPPSSGRARSASNHEQLLDRYPSRDKMLFDHVLDQRLEGGSIGFHPVRPRIAAEHVIDLVHVGGKPGESVAQRAAFLHQRERVVSRIAQRVVQALRDERVRLVDIATDDDEVHDREDAGAPMIESFSTSR